MILIFCFQSNKHWHENEPEAETSNEKMKLVFQLTDQKHFIHYNQAFIWRDLFYVCAHARVYCTVCVCLCVWMACVSTCKYIIHVSVCAMLLLVIATPRHSLWHFPTFCTRTSWLVVSVYTILSLIFHCCIYHSSSQINFTGQITNYTCLSCYRDLGWEAGTVNSL